MPSVKELAKAHDKKMKTDHAPDKAGMVGAKSHVKSTTSRKDKAKGKKTQKKLAKAKSRSAPGEETAKCACVIM